MKAIVLQRRSKINFIAFIAFSVVQSLLVSGCATKFSSVSAPAVPYILPGPSWWGSTKISAVGPQTEGWQVTGGKQVTNDWLYTPEDKDLVDARHANFLMFSKYIGPRSKVLETFDPLAEQPKGILLGAFVLPEPIPLPEGGLEELREQISKGQFIEPGLKPVARPYSFIKLTPKESIRVTAGDFAGRPGIQFVFDNQQSLNPSSATKDHHIIKTFWFPESLRPGSKIVRVGYFQHIYNSEDLSPIDLESEVAPIFQSIKFISDK